MVLLSAHIERWSVMPYMLSLLIILKYTYQFLLFCLFLHKPWIPVSSIVPLFVDISHLLVNIPHLSVLKSLEPAQLLRIKEAHGRDSRILFIEGMFIYLLQPQNEQKIIEYCYLINKRLALFVWWHQMFETLGTWCEYLHQTWE